MRRAGEGVVRKHGEVEPAKAEVEARKVEAEARKADQRPRGPLQASCFLWAALAGLAVLAGMAVPAPLVAQVGGSGEAGEQEKVDSTRLRIQKRLETLGRPPGLPADSLYPDSMLVRGRGGRRVGQPDMAAGDTIIASLLEALGEGYNLTSYQGLRAEYEGETGELVLHADSTRRAAVLQPDGSRLEADSLIEYVQDRGLATAEGDPTYTPSEGDPVSGRRLVFDTRRGAGSAYDARTTYDQGGGTNWNVTGDLNLISPERQYGSHTRFTSCELDDPHYHFQTDRLKIVNGSVLVARPVRLYFGDVPVAWLPFVAQSLGEDRSSGLLPVRFSVNDIVRASGGHRRRVSNIGYYWAINEFMDATVALDWFDENYTAVTGSYRYRWLEQFMDGQLSFRRFWRVEGGKELSLDTRHRWEISERTRFNLAASFASSTSFVRRNSFDPREVTQQIRSQGGLSHRFDWGTVNVSADRSESLSNDEVNMSLPRIGLSLRPITLLEAPTASARWYNNITWSGSANFTRRTTDRADAEEGFSFSTADVGDMNGSVSSTLTLGRLSLGQSLNVTQGTVRGVPEDSLSFFPALIEEEGLGAFTSTRGLRALASQARAEGQLRDVTTTDLSWNASIDYQQTLIGTTTLTPRFTISGQARKADTVEVAQDFVSAPTRMAFGAALKADFYGFYPGIGGFEAIRHKLSSSVTYDWSPEVEPTELQNRVFNVRTLQPKSVVALTLNQTWEAKDEDDEEEDRGLVEEQMIAESARIQGDSLTRAEADSIVLARQAETDSLQAEREEELDERGLRRPPTSQIVNLLSLRTSVLRYDFVEADSVGTFLSGFETTTLQNQISSDFLRGLTVSMTHDLFEEETVTLGDGSTREERSFAPHLSALNFGFSLNANSTILRWLDFGGGDDEAPGRQAGREEEDADDDAFSQRAATDETSIVPGRSTDGDVQQSRRRSLSSGRGWRGNFSYALTRPREGGDRVSQILQMGWNLSPTPNWEMSWNTAYNIEDGSFNDHRIRLTRDLHRWQAHFDFLKTATGNWTFRFEVSLLDNKDLHFDYEQRSLDAFDDTNR